MEKQKTLDFKKDRNRGSLLLLFLISPIIALLIAVANYSKRHFHFIIILFAFLYGYTLIPIENSDVERYSHYYNVVSQYNWSDFVNQIVNIYAPSARFNDVYIIGLMYICSVFSLSFNFFLGLHAVIYFSMLLSAINLILDNSSEYNYKKYLAFLIGCVLTYSFSGAITGIRFQAGFMFFMLFALKYIFSNKIKYILLAGLSCLFHISIIPVYLGLLLYYLLGFVKNYKLKFLFILFFVLALYSFNIFELTQGVEVLDSKVESYTREGFVESREAHTQNWNWYVQLNQFATYYFLIVAMGLTRFNYFKSNKLIKDVFLLALILLVISIFNETVLDSISNRYRLFFEFVGLLYLFLLFSYNEKTKHHTILKNFYLLVLTLKVLISLRVDSYTYDVIRLTLSPLFTILGFQGANIYEFI